MMAKTVGDFVWQRLREWGVGRVFGYPGDGINGLVGALDRPWHRGAAPLSNVSQHLHVGSACIAKDRLGL
jgi:phage terminase large subunit GpA-like protein